MNLTESTPPLFLLGVRFQYFGISKTKLYDALDSWYFEFTIIIINLLSTLICMLSVKLPPAFCASQVYSPSSLSVTFVKSRDDVLSLDRRSPFLKKDSCGSGKPSIILHVRLALSPSRKGLLGPNKSTTGRTIYRKKY